MQISLNEIQGMQTQFLNNWTICCRMIISLKSRCVESGETCSEKAESVKGHPFLPESCHSLVFPLTHTISPTSNNGTRGRQLAICHDTSNVAPAARGNKDAFIYVTHIERVVLCMGRARSRP